VLLPFGWSDFRIGKAVRGKNQAPTRNENASGFGKHLLVVIEVLVTHKLRTLSNEASGKSSFSAFISTN
jgi:hypothetical protein